jgi:hypothetical protein
MGEGPPARDLAFDNAGRLWILTADRFHSPEDPSAPARRNVIAIDRGGRSDTWLERSGAVGAPVVVTSGGQCRRVHWPLGVQANASVWHGPASILISAEEPGARGRRRFELAALDAGGASHILFSGEIGDWLGAPPVRWIPTSDGALVLMECDTQARLFRCSPGVPPVPISPGNLEVRDFDYSSPTDAVALVGSPMDVGGEAESWLAVGSLGVWRAQGFHIARGVHSRPRWGTRGTRLYWLKSRGGWSAEAVSAKARDLPSLPPAPSTVRATRVAGRTLVELGSSGATAAILLVQGPHRQFLKGAQNLLFHQTIAVFLARLCGARCRLLVLNGRGSTGAGRRRRELTEPWPGAVADDLLALVETLRASGVERIGAVSVSLGSVALMELLARTALNSAVMIAPVFDRNAVPPRWAHLVGPDFEHRMIDIAGDLQVPLLTIQGVRDEVSPVTATSRVVAAVPEETPCTYETLEEEGHIFVRPQSWQQAFDAISFFLERRLFDASPEMRRAVEAMR